jgi:UDP-N-acetylglucosamine acyltransferase
MSSIDPTARVEDGAVIGEGAVIGPFCMIGPEVTIGPRCRLIGHVYIAGKTTLGADCVVYPFASLGAQPQSLAHRGEITRLDIGEGCTIRESATIGAGTVGGGGITRVGKRGFFMNCTHIAHDCQIGDDVILATSAAIGGHSEIGDFVFLGALSGVHQFSRIGAQAMVGALSGVHADIIPYAIVNGQRATLRGLNLVGMKRRKFTTARLSKVRNFYHKLFHAPGLFADRLADVRSMAGDDPAIDEILAFIDAGRKRELCVPPVGRD